jgi:hypothetical protein
MHLYMLSELEPFNLTLPYISIQLPSLFLQRNSDSYNHNNIGTVRALGSTTAQAVSHQLLNAETRVRSQEK